MLTSLGQDSAAQVNALGVAFSTDTTLLAGQSPLTVFAPTNEAFEALPKVDLIFSTRMMMKTSAVNFDPSKEQCLHSTMNIIIICAKHQITNASKNA